MFRKLGSPFTLWMFLNNGLLHSKLARLFASMWERNINPVKICGKEDPIWYHLHFQKNVYRDLLGSYSLLQNVELNTSLQGGICCQRSLLGKKRRKLKIA
jgi:hypothetical protein